MALRRASLVLLGGSLVAAACGADAAMSSDVGRACDLLATKAEVMVSSGTVTVSIGDTLTMTLPGGWFDVLIYLQPNRSSELDDVAEDLWEIPGVGGVQILDQEDVYDEFALLAEYEQLIETVTPKILPLAQVRVDLWSETEFEAIEAAFRGDERIFQIVDAYGIRAEAIADIARRFQEKLEELERITRWELRDAIAVIRSEAGPTRSELHGVHAAVSDFLGRECDESSG